MPSQMSEVTIEHLKHTLLRVKAGNEFSPQSQAMALLLLAELANVNFDLVLGQDITLAMETFQLLRERVNYLEVEKKSVRNDDLALTFMEATNKFRDNFERHLTDESQK